MSSLGEEMTEKSAIIRKIQLEIWTAVNTWKNYALSHLRDATYNVSDNDRVGTQSIGQIRKVKGRDRRKILTFQVRVNCSFRFF